jgi:hypothetical protein
MVEMLGVCLDQGNVSRWCLDRLASCHLEHLAAAVHADNLPAWTDGREEEREIWPGPAADVQHPGSLLQV